MIGNAKNVMVSTVELQEYAAEGANTFVAVDHQLCEVVSVVFYSTDHAKVTLEPPYGDDLVFEVGSGDYDEPMWEVEGQS